MSAFILAAGELDRVPASSELHLMPFALTPTPASAPVSAFFRPRIAPEGHAFAGSRVAAFRGRQVVGQSIDVPKGYRGVVLRTDALPGKGTPLTPATSVATSVATSISASSSSASIASTPDVSSSARTTRAAARAKGSGQVALSRPRATRRAAAPSKRFRLDDDDDEEDSGEPAPKRARAAAKISDENTPERPKTPEPTLVPEINVVTATPGGEEQAREVDLSISEPADAPTPTDATGAPDPPLQAAPSHALVAEAEYEGSDGRPARVLVPTATFERITLWTPDAPLAGFREAELAINGHVTDLTTEEKKVDVDVKEDEEGASAALPPTATQLERSWWRQGGAGEGGDEFVRALGEWLGLTQIIHEPTYLDGTEDE